MEKSPDAFRTISEAADDLNLPQHVLRFWETRFNQIKPLKRGGGRRYYRPEDVDLLRGIRHLLYEEGYTIRGVQRILREQGNRFVIGIGSGEIDITDPAAVLAAAGSPEGAALVAAVESAAEQPVAGKKAVSVEEYTAGPGQVKSGRGLLGRLRGNRDEEEVDGIAEGSGLSAGDRRHLQATLYELLECKRLLDQVRSD
ncbi:MAG: MerR family transcriptional regulator [Nitratireductor sp.]|nr:MerR family transcriptional regulator [Nitratireductor sp.]